MNDLGFYNKLPVGIFEDVLAVELVGYRFLKWLTFRIYAITSVKLTPKSSDAVSTNRSLRKIIDQKSEFSDFPVDRKATLFRIL